MVCTAPSVRSLTAGAPSNVLSKARHGLQSTGTFPNCPRDARALMASYPAPHIDAAGSLFPPQRRCTACSCTAHAAAAASTSCTIPAAGTTGAAPTVPHPAPSGFPISPSRHGAGSCTARPASNARQSLLHMETAKQQRRPAAVVLGIESSCDDTGVAVVTSEGRVLGEALATQAEIHCNWGGVVPNLARDAHAAAIDRTVESALAAAGLAPQQLSAIAVTIGPGLGLCLRVGAAKARQMARQYGIPMVSVHHMEAHALVARLPAAAAAAAAPVVRLAAVATPTSGSAAESSQQPMTMTLRHEDGLRSSEARGPAPVSGLSPSSSLSHPPSPPWEPRVSPPKHPQHQQGRQQQQPTQDASSPPVDIPTDGPQQSEIRGENGDGATSRPPPSRPGATSTANSSTAAAADGDSGGSGARAGGLCTAPPGGAAAAAPGLAAAAPGLDPDAVLSDVAAAAAVPFPFLCLLVSGGHNLLVLVRGVGRYVQLGSTVDDSLGEAYDKVARLLNLELRPHGGAALETLAREGDPKAFKFAVPMRQHATCDFSFAGLKTNTRLAIEQQLRPDATEQMVPEHLRKVKADIAASFQSVAVTHLMEKTRRGVAWARELVPGLRHLVVAGGVACNRVVRSSLQGLAEAEGLELVLPPARWCTDNGVMVAWVGIERLALGWAEPPPPPLPSSPLSAAAGTTKSTAPSAAAAATGGGAASTLPSMACTTSDQALLGSGSGSGSGPETEAEWIDLKPRWPLTSDVHPRVAAVRQEQRRSVKKVRMHTPLSDLAPPVGTAAAARAAEAQAVAPAARSDTSSPEAVLVSG